MLLDILIENLAFAALHIETTRDGSPVAYDLAPGEQRRLVMDALHMQDRYYWYDFVISFPTVKPNLAKPVILHGPKIISIEPHTPPSPTGTGFIYTP